jgi:hypothetical protein
MYVSYNCNINLKLFFLMLINCTSKHFVYFKIIQILLNLTNNRFLKLLLVTILYFYIYNIYIPLADICFIFQNLTKKSSATYERICLRNTTKKGKLLFLTFWIEWWLKLTLRFACVISTTRRWARLQFGCLCLSLLFI